MPFIAWNDEMSVGVKELDDDHKEIVDLLNRLHEGVEAGIGNSEVVNIFSKLVEATKRHLHHEEQILAKAGFPHLAQHLKEHDAILGKGLMLQARFMSGSTQPFTLAEVDLACRWLQTHLIESDKHYAQYLKSQGLS